MSDSTKLKCSNCGNLTHPVPIYFRHGFPLFLDGATHVDCSLCGITLYYLRSALFTYGFVLLLLMSIGSAIGVFLAINKYGLFTSKPLELLMATLFYGALTYGIYFIQRRVAKRADVIRKSLAINNQYFTSQQGSRRALCIWVSKEIIRTHYELLS